MKLPITFILNETYQTSTPESRDSGIFTSSGFNFENESFTSNSLLDYFESERFIYPSSSNINSKSIYITNIPPEDRLFFEKGEETTKTLHLVSIIDADGAKLSSDKQDLLWSKIIERHIGKDNEMSHSDQEYS